MEEKRSNSLPQISCRASWNAGRVLPWMMHSSGNRTQHDRRYWMMFVWTIPLLLLLRGRSYVSSSPTPTTTNNEDSTVSYFVVMELGLPSENVSEPPRHTTLGVVLSSSTRLDSCRSIELYFIQRFDEDLGEFKSEKRQNHD